MDLTGDAGVLKTIIVHSPLDPEKQSHFTPKPEDIVSVIYKGYLASDPSIVFDEQAIYPFRFTVGSPNVIKGWNILALSMKVGETSSFTLLPSYAYGEAGSPPEILPSSTIIFDISLIAINGVTLSDATKNPNPSSITVDPVMERLAKVRLDREKNELKRQIEKKATEIKKQMAKEKLAKKSAGSKKKKKKI
ncbi:hypothetical protein ScalyP_jg10374 [Parmales sp. scaly parma]|nr:hypothetical protein ScalyP_jg10374 [Parmales sp. scaly parma]|tara:strand:+ start:601 stop:1176 length:576 start_codon:yes stop_codon:yes gene_type:complete